MEAPQSTKLDVLYTEDALFKETNKTYCACVPQGANRETSCTLDIVDQVEERQMKAKGQASYCT
eukprot:scaffold83277_cov30-Prasinocladus_malaysianus.AAC.1